MKDYKIDVIDVIAEGDKVYVSIPPGEKGKQFELNLTEFMDFIKDNSIEYTEFDY